jgi:uncharacterized pyridoxal phosphate-containing UPF0001 family protein
VPGSPGRVLATPPPADVVVARVATLRQRIEEAGRDPADVRIVAVTKGFTAGAVDAARAAGLYDIGENYADELLAKIGSMPPATDGASGASEGSPPTRWHYLGAIQRRRVRMLAPVVSCWQTVCRVSEGRAIASHAGNATVLVEVETTSLPGRNGTPPSEVPALVSSLTEEGLDVRGLMVVGPPGPPEQARPAFRVVADLARHLGLPEVSMGMTDDLEVALSEGSTMLRVGRALFGERPLGRM